MSWWSLRRNSRRHREQREPRLSQWSSKPLSQHQAQQPVPSITVDGDTTPVEQLERRKRTESHKKTRVPVHHRASTTSTESEGYGSQDASSSSLPRTRSSLSSLQGIPEEPRKGTEVSPKSLHKNVSTTSVCSESSTASYHTAMSNTRPSPTKYLEQLPPEEKTRLEKLERMCQESMEEHEGLKKRIAELEDRVKTLESVQPVVPYEDCGVNNSKNTLPVNLPVSQDVIIVLAKRITRWKFLARYLDFQEHEIQRIHDEHQNDVQEQCYQMLWNWKQTHPNGGDCLALGEAVRKDLGDSFYFEFVKLVTENMDGSQCTSPC